jgi:hypothetical protein
MSDSELLHKTLYYALIEMRNCARESNDRVVFGLCDLFHNVVMPMGEAAEGKRTYDDVLQQLEDAAEEKGSSAWLANVWTQIR